MAVFFKIAPLSKYLHQMRVSGCFTGTCYDIQAGFIHMSTPSQIQETLAKKFEPKRDVLFAIDIPLCSGNLKFEPGKNGLLYPHLYRGNIPEEAVRWAMKFDDVKKKWKWASAGQYVFKQPEIVLQETLCMTNQIWEQFPFKQT